jgi:hypothetical protein
MIGRAVGAPRRRDGDGGVESSPGHARVWSAPAVSVSHPAAPAAIRGLLRSARFALAVWSGLPAARGDGI